MDYRIRTILGLIGNDVRNAPTPRQMAGELGLSLSHFYDLFRKETGTVPAAYTRKLRYEKAHELLITSGFSVKEITDLVGIHDVSHFVRDFKKLYGMSPRTLRRSYGSSSKDGPAPWIPAFTAPPGNLANKP